MKEHIRSGPYNVAQAYPAAAVSKRAGRERRLQIPITITVFGLLLSSVPALANSIERVSVATGGAQATGTPTIAPDSAAPDISADGRYVAFASKAVNLVTGDTNNNDVNNGGDIFVHDRQTNTTVRVNVSSIGDQTTSGNSDAPVISADGRFVAFHSKATNLVTGDTNADFDVFVHDRDADGNGIFDEPGAISTVRVSVASDGTQAAGRSLNPAISADGRYVAFQSSAANLVSGDTNNTFDVFVHDRSTGTTERVSVATGGTQVSQASTAPAISADGRYVAFESRASLDAGVDVNGQQPDIFVYDRLNNTTVQVSVDSNGNGSDSVTGSNGSVTASISADGRFVAFCSQSTNLVPSDTNNKADIFVHDRDADEDGIFDEPGWIATERVSVTSSGMETDTVSVTPAISADGRYVAFTNTDLSTSTSTLVAGDSNSVADVFIHDRDADGNGILDEPGPGSTFTRRVSVAGDDSQANFESDAPAMAADGGQVAFASRASNLVAGDTNFARDIFVVEIKPDGDGDGVPDDEDICPGGDDNVDSDGDLVPDFCDPCPYDSQNDADGDGVCGDMDVCPGGDDGVNTDGDALPDSCDVCPFDAANDADDDGICGDVDNCPTVANSNQDDNDYDGFGDACDSDDDNDGVMDGDDNCPLYMNNDQADADGDGAGDVCDSDDDNDGVGDGDDACLTTPLGEVVDATGCAISDDCPCEYPVGGAKWKNHGGYVSCVAHAAQALVDAALITEAEKDAIVSAAGESDCGDKK